ncbi:hypothetical protein AD998_16290 [bacterium 336/3]|nr:hypothetical protein AD998_16290 [bacterium 336/3]
MNYKILQLSIFFNVLIFSLQAQKLTPKQQAKLDSLKGVLKKDIVDTLKVQALIRLCQVYFHSGEKQAVEYNDQAFELSTKINYQRGLVWATHNKGTFLIAQGKYDEAKEYLNKALLLAKGKYTMETVPILYDLGVVNRRSGNQPKGLDYYLEALKVLETIQVKTKESNVQYCNITQAIGVIYFEQDDYDKAISFFEKSSNKCKEINYELGLSYNYNGLGGTYRKMKNYAKAMEYLRKSLELANKNHYERLRADLLGDIGEIYQIQNQADSSLNYYIESKKISETLSDSVGIANSMLGIANAYTIKGNLRDAQTTASEGLEIALKLNNLQNIKEAYKVLADIYEAKKQPQEALDYFKKAKELEDTLYNAEKHKQILQVQNQYENYKKEEQVLKQKYEIEDLKKQNKIGFLFTVLLIVALLSTVLISYLLIKQKQLKAKKDKVLMELEQAMLKEEQMQTQLELSNTRLQLEGKDKELTSFTLNMIQKNELLNELKGQVEDLISKSEDKSVIQPLQRLKQNIQSNDQSDKQWENFRVAFEQVHKTFFNNLQQQYPDITPYDLKLSALLRLNFSSKEIASFLSISEDSVKKARYRLRKKLNLEQDENLVGFLMKIEET